MSASIAALARAEATAAARRAEAAQEALEIVHRPVGRRRGTRAAWRDLAAAVRARRPAGRHRAGAC